MFVTTFRDPMRRFTTILGTAFLFFFTSALVLLNACNQDTCKTLICKNNGVCRDGRCKCASGFEGANCETKMYEKFIGTYDGKYRCNGTTEETITTIVTPGDKPDNFTIHDIFAIDLDTKAIIDQEHSERFYLVSQTVGDYKYEGQGDIVGRYMTIFIQETYIPDGTIHSCVYNAIKYIKP
jgi:hypothetical protein